MKINGTLYLPIQFSWRLRWAAIVYARHFNIGHRAGLPRAIASSATDTVVIAVVGALRFTFASRFGLARQFRCRLGRTMLLLIQRWPCCCCCRCWRCWRWRCWRGCCCCRCRRRYTIGGSTFASFCGRRLRIHILTLRRLRRLQLLLITAFTSLWHFSLVLCFVCLFSLCFD